MLAVMAYQRRELVQHSAPIRTAAEAYRPARATTNSSRVVMLISLMSALAGEHQSEQIT